MDISKKQELFQKYVSGKATDEDVHLLMQLIDEGGVADLANQSDKLWSDNHLFPQIDEEVARRMKSRVMASASAEQAKEKTIGRREFPYWLRVAAVLVPLIAFTLVFYWINGEGNRLESNDSSEVISYVEKINPKGQKSTLVLSDGSMVILNADSKLVYKESFDRYERRVVLEGEAFFNVKRDASRPFVIVTDQITTTVLGTSFSVRAYPGGAHVKVAVASGRVAVQELNSQSQPGEDQGLLLIPGEMGVYGRANKTLNKTSFDERDLFGWKDGLIYFKNANINEIKARLEQWYGVTIVMEKQISLEKDFSGAYKNKTLELVLNSLAFVYDFNYEIKDKMIRIY